jgi:hypothetical protein
MGKKENRFLMMTFFAFLQRTWREGKKSDFGRA